MPNIQIRKCNENNTYDIQKPYAYYADSCNFAQTA